ncbi:MAG: hypothetical protein IJC37_00135 [Clostridia bacterium]|nr:hypothetical protein [Clostridia bacterium]
MKRNKNDAVVNKDKMPENTESLSGSVIPSEKVNTVSNEEKGLPFKKVLYGYNPEEVQSFINELTKSCEASLKLHESKLSAMKEELAFSNRERDIYIKKCKEYQSQIREKTLPVEADADEYNVIIAQLRETVNALEAENEELRNRQNASCTDSVKEYTERIAMLESLNGEMKAALSCAENKNEELLQQAERFAEISDEYEAAKQKLENAESKLLLCEKELKIKCDEAEEKDAKLNACAEEKNDAQKKIAELEVENNILMQRTAESEDEISKLRETNKALIFENAEKISALENEHNKSKLEFRKERKLYGYYVERAELTVAELTKQIEQIKESVCGSEV